MISSFLFNIFLLLCEYKDDEFYQYPQLSSRQVWDPERMQSASKQRLKSNTLGLPELARLEDIFVRSFEEAVEKGVPDDAAGTDRSTLPFMSTL